MNAYKQVEKKWKQLKINEENDLIYNSQVNTMFIDPSHDNSKQLIQIGECEICPGKICPIYALCDQQDKENEHSGFYLIPGALDIATQQHLALKCMTEYAEEPHVTNLHPLNQQIKNIWQKSLEWKPTDEEKKDPMEKLHWAALGYQYNWTDRAYPNEPGSSIPIDLRELGQLCAKVVGFELTSEAALVNYYKASSTMGGHQDNVEQTFDYPVVSFSIGCSAIFLKGGLTKESKPIEILLRSGDVAIMGGNSRLCFHGIAKTLPVKDLDAFPLADEDATIHPIAKYLRTNRLNINVRQVYPSSSSPSRKRFKTTDNDN